MPPEPVQIFSSNIQDIKLSRMQMSEITSNNQHILRAGHKLIYSASYYLDHMNSGGDWQKYYVKDPRQMVLDSYNKTNILGGEACMWAEAVDDSNFITRVWPRASAVAEVLWSAPHSFSNIPERYSEYQPKVARKVNCRLEEHVCRMKRRGVGAQPASGPGFCYGG